MLRGDTRLFSMTTLAVWRAQLHLLAQSPLSSPAGPVSVHSAERQFRLRATRSVALPQKRTRDHVERARVIQILRHNSIQYLVHLVYTYSSGTIVLCRSMTMRMVEMLHESAFPFSEGRTARPL